MAAHPWRAPGSHEEPAIQDEQPIQRHPTGLAETVTVEPPGEGWLDLARTEPPATRSGVIVRTRLLEELGPRHDVRVVSVVAPAGYGKTTLLSQWAALHGETSSGTVPVVH